ncbi:MULTISPECIES: hypothetical protein [Streptomyces]|uniref:Uncharacterized protein n=1 Tax=Streptomyces zinciresistens K42 TaxID=700597 RepID=G2G653_9ACTN|nr:MULTISPECIES: hypothetical protein [Streptomyces]EGX61142.1 hypothetical protein SZN_04796 [Streptomyces zinciresistens K42]MDT9696662.1 hypothetical protein [Streptomyces sp. P17]
MDLSIGGPYYAAVVLAIATALAVLISAISGHRHGNPTAGLPILLLGLIAAEGPASYGAFVDGDLDTDLAGPVEGGLLGFGVGAVAGLIIVVLLVAHWARRNDGEQ